MSFQVRANLERNVLNLFLRCHSLPLLRKTRVAENMFSVIELHCDIPRILIGYVNRLVVGFSEFVTNKLALELNINDI